MKACQPCILCMSGSCLAVGCGCAGSLGGEPVMRLLRAEAGARSVGAVLGGRGGRGAVRAPFVPFGRSSRSACVTERSVGAYGVVGATRAGRSRVRCVWTPRDLGGDQGRSGEIGEIGDIGICPRFYRDLPRSRSDRTSSLPIFGILEVWEVSGNFQN